MIMRRKNDKNRSNDKRDSDKAENDLAIDVDPTQLRWNGKRTAMKARGILETHEGRHTF
jgi:hypothetical protein